MNKLTCFKAYDIRGELGVELDEDVAYRIGRAYSQLLNPSVVVVGGDARETSEPLKMALARGLMESGVDVIDIGMVGTEEIYFATSHLGVDGGIEVTASHNPINYNGMKLVQKGSKPISGDSGLKEIQRLSEENVFESVDASSAGGYRKESITKAYVDHLLTYIEKDNLIPLKLVVNSGNGAAGHVIDALEVKFSELGVPIEFIKVHHLPDSTFPNGIPNPLIPERRIATATAVLEHGADIGIAWDGDFDRCFLFDENGQFIEGYYIVGLLGEAFAKKNPGAKIIHDPRLTWNTIEIVKREGAEPVQCKTGHAFIKERMRDIDAVYGGEMSAHHYFRDFFYCDSGMIPWLLVAELMSMQGCKLSEMVSDRIDAFPSSGEINSTISEPNVSIQRVLEAYRDESVRVDVTDGISMEFAGDEGEWRFNLRASNTEPLVRLNVESRANVELMEKKTQEVLTLLMSE